MDKVQCVVAGAGVVGLAIGRALARTGLEVVIAEAAPAIGTGTSSRNSEVIHAGIYYPTGSLKARWCVAGKTALYEYCAAKAIPHRRIGKLIVATTEAEIATLEKYLAQAVANGVDDLTWLTAAEVAEREPQIVAVRGLLSPSTGIIDSHAYMLALQGDLEASGGVVALNSPITAARSNGAGFEIEAGGDRLDCDWLINAAGLDAPGLASRTQGLDPACVPRAYFAKGHYYSLTGKSPFRQLVYPQAGGGGLGVHVTLDLSGTARFGPDVAWQGGIDYSFDESNRQAFVDAIRRYYPALDEQRLQPSYTGIRPKISGPGEPAADFLVQGPNDHGLPGLVNLFGIESPGLTASLAIADHVTGLLAAESG